MTTDTERIIPLAAGREADIRFIMDCVGKAACCSIVGVSNMGKSTLLRAVTQEEVRRACSPDEADRYRFVYIDCNRALERSAQGFYELVLRVILEELSDQINAQAMADIRESYDRLVGSSDGLRVALSFTEGLAAAIQGSEQPLVLLFDEFDEILREIDARVFLNLRALKDRHQSALRYVTATDHRLPQIRPGRQVGEFYELFAHHTRHLPPLDEEGVQALAREFARQEGVTFDDEDLTFIRDRAGGHPGLLEVVCRALGEVTGAPIRNPIQDRIIHQQVADRLDGDINVRSECTKLWDDLAEAERETLLAIVAPGFAPDMAKLRSLLRKRLVQQTQNGPVLFCKLFEDFVRRQRALRRPKAEGVRVDVEAGYVYVDGVRIPPLTDLEYRLLLLLYGRLDKICSKYEIVEHVWGQDYIDEVDDARVDRLVRRLRHKIEPDPRNPRYLLTVRGRGYRLVSP